MGSAEVRAEPEPLTTMRVLGMDGADQFDNKSQREDSGLDAQARSRYCQTIK
jgi:hypothetical protein